MNLHQNPDQFRNAILAASQSYGIPDIYIEKDYWVTLALKHLFHSILAEELVFKGGTALSKCFRLIERFSEDIDVVVIRRPGETDSRLTKKIRMATAIVNEVLPETVIESLTNKKGRIRKTVHEYQKASLSGEFGQVRSHIVLEASWLGNFEPHTKSQVSSYIADMLLARGLQDKIQEWGLEPFAVNVLCIERTFCEKVMSLVRWSRSGSPYRDLANKIRHVYDIHQLLQDSRIRDFLAGNEFSDMMLKVADDDAKCFGTGAYWLVEHPGSALIFKDRDATWARLRGTYHSLFRELVIGSLPSEIDLLNSLRMVHDRLGKLEWRAAG